MSVFSGNTNFPGAFSNSQFKMNNNTSNNNTRNNSNNGNNGVFGKNGSNNFGKPGNPNQRKRKVFINNHNSNTSNNNQNHQNTNQNHQNNNNRFNNYNNNPNRNNSKRTNDKNQDRRKNTKKKDKLNDKTNDKKTFLNGSLNDSVSAFDLNSPTPESLETPAKVLPRQSQEQLQNFSNEETSLIGPLFSNPESLGFQRKTPSLKRPIPRYMLTQPRQLITPPFIQNQWDKENQDKMRSMESSNKDFQGLYEEFQKMRETERSKMESLGLVDAENISKDLTDAIAFQGSCLEMCPIFERVRRQLENNVKALEKDPHTNKISPTKAIKAFSRPAAGQAPPLPSEVRPPHILKQTLDHMVDEIVPQLPEAHSFIWDRTRSIRQDFTYQNFFGPEAIDCNERIVRIHLISLHIMAGADVEYSQQQELEQFNKALQTLIEIYQDIRNHGGNAPNEPEFRAYYLLSHYRDAEVEREIQELPDFIFKSPEVQLALKFRTILSQNNIVERGFQNPIGALNLFLEFFKLVYSPETPLLFACLLETHFNEIRFYALKAMSRCYHTRGKAYLAESLKDMLGFDSIEGLVKFIEYYEIDSLNDNGELLIDLFNKDKLSNYKLNSINDKPRLSQPCSKQIDDKIIGPLKSFVNCGKPTYTLNLKTSKDREVIPSNLPAQKPTFSSQGAFGGFSQVPVQPGGSKSLSDFLSSSGSTPGFGTSQAFGARQGFGASAPSQPTNTFGTSQTFDAPKVSNNTKPFGASQAPAGTSTTNVGSQSLITPKPGFSSTDNAPKLFPKPQAPLAESKQDSFNFKSFGNPSVDKAKQPNPVQSEKESSSSSPINFKPSSRPNVPAQDQQQFLFKPAIESHTPKQDQPSFKTNPPTIPSLTEKPKKDFIPEKPKLKDHKHFGQALEKVYNEILQSTIDDELFKLLPKLMRIENRNQERKKIINSFSNELYQAFISEIIYNQTLKAQAINFYETNLKRFILRRLSDKGEQLKVKHELRRKKLDELNSISFKVPTLKRRSSNASLSSLGSTKMKKRLNFTENEPSFNHISERQTEVRKLWEPIDLSQFLKTCSKHIKLSIDSFVELKFLLVIENWTSPYSKWLNTKLMLKINKERMIYENKISNDRMSINLQSLPQNNYLNKDFFGNTAFILFEAGFFNDGQISRYNGDLSSKLQRDETILNKIIQLCSRYGYYKVQILLVFWNISKSDTPDVSNLLKIPEHKNNSVIEDIIVCDMTAKDQNINGILLEGFNNLSDGFTGDLTPRGAKKKEKLRKLNENKKRKMSESPAPVTDSMDEHRAKESEYLKRAKHNRQYGYLANHISNVSNSSIKSRNNSINDSTSLYLSAINRTQNNSSTFLNLNSSIGNDTTFKKDLSILPSFGEGVGIIEESTPFASPKGKSFTKPAPKNISNNVEILRNLTASIKAKYKK